MQYKATNIGEEILIKGIIPIMGISSLTTYIDVVTGETINRFWNKYFRWTKEGINYTDWILLTDANLVIVGSSLDVEDLFFIDYKYIRAGIDTSGVLTVEDLELVGSYIIPQPSQSYEKSIFNDFLHFYQIGVIRWMVNVFEKLFKPGIIPIYIERGSDPQNREIVDEDFISFWRTVSYFFGLIVNYGKVFENFPEIESLLKEYIKQKGLFFCEEGETIDGLKFLMSNYYNQISKRGTLEIIGRKSEDPTLEINGEFLRLICFNDCNEFLFSLRKYRGWNIGNSSPLYRGTNQEYMLIKGYEKTKDAIDTQNYPFYESSSNEQIITKNIYQNFQNRFILTIFAPTSESSQEIIFTIIQSGIFNNPLITATFNYIGDLEQVRFDIIQFLNTTETLNAEFGDNNDIIITQDLQYSGDYCWFTFENIQFTEGRFEMKNFGDVLEFFADDDSISGIGDPSNPYKRISINRNIDYEITFQISLEDSDDFVEFGVIGFDKDGTISNPISIIDGSSTPTFGNINCGANNNRWYNIRGIIFNQNQPLNPQDILNYGDGGNLKFTTNICKIMPYIIRDNRGNIGNTGKVWIYDLKVRPLKTDYSLGFVQPSNIIETWITNNNMKISTVEIYDIVRKFLIPYDSTLIFNILPQACDCPPKNIIADNFWQLADATGPNDGTNIWLNPNGTGWVTS